MTGYDFHPEARIDLDDIWEFIRLDDVDAADRMIAEILSAIEAVTPFPVGVIDGRTSHRAPCGSSRFVNI